MIDVKIAMTDTLIILLSILAVWIAVAIWMRKPRTGAFNTAWMDESRAMTMIRRQMEMQHKDEHRPKTRKVILSPSNRYVLAREAYDPMKDEEKILRGEVESYFD